MNYERYQPDWAAYDRRVQSGSCFICNIVSDDHDLPRHIVYEDDHVIAFLNNFPNVFGYTLIAPREHRTQVTADFNRDEYLKLQARVHAIGEAVRQEVRAERIYLLSLGSNQANAHVHWHVVPLPPGVPYEKQQFGLWQEGVLRIPEEDCKALADRIGARIEELNAFPG